MARNKGISEFSVNFEPTGQSIFDARLTVATKNDLYTAYNDNNNYYPKMVVMVEDENMQYVLVDTEERDNEAGWKSMRYLMDIPEEMNISWTTYE